MVEQAWCLCREYRLLLIRRYEDFRHIAIRTMILKIKTYVQAGAGIVYDSIAQKRIPREAINKLNL